MSYTNPTSTTPDQPISRNTFNFNVLQSEVDYENPLQIVDLKRVIKNPNFLCPPKNNESGCANPESEDSYKFLMIFADKTIPMGKKRAWITQLEKIGTKKRDLLKKFKTSIVALQENEAMKELSGKHQSQTQFFPIQKPESISLAPVHNLHTPTPNSPHPSSNLVSNKPRDFWRFFLILYPGTGTLRFPLVYWSQNIYFSHKNFS